MIQIPRKTCVVGSVGLRCHLLSWGGRGILNDGLIRQLASFQKEIRMPLLREKVRRVGVGLGARKPETQHWVLMGSPDSLWSSGCGMSLFPSSH